MRKIISITISSMVFYFLFAACNPIAHLGEDPEVAKWENEVKALESLPVSSNPSTVFFTGSSSIRLWESIALDMAPYPAIARGYGGAKLNDFVYYSQRITGPQAFGAVVVFIANDITGDNTDKTPETMLKLMKQTVKQIRKTHPGVPVFWIEITPTPSRWNSWKQISAANDLISNYCEKQPNLYFIPTSDHFLGQDGKPQPELFQQDMLHLSEAGYRTWATCIRQKLDAEVPELKAN